MSLKIDKKDKGKVYVVDFDDLCDATVGTLDVLDKVKEKYPNFKCTLFTIPARTSQSTIDAAKGRDWLCLAPHGYFHTRGECLGWKDDEAVDKIKMAVDMGIDGPIFRAPAWLLDGDVYKACKELEYVVASHREFRLPRQSRAVLGDVMEYVYNAPNLRLKWTRGVHGHLTPVCDNFVGDMWEDGRLGFRDGCKFLWAHEAAVVEG